MPGSAVSVTTDAPERSLANEQSDRSLRPLFGSFPRILYGYIFREIQSPFWLTLFVFTGLLFLGRSIKLVELIVNKNVPFSDTIILFSYVIPGFLEIATPMALLLAIILGFARLSNDSELVVMRSVGFTPFRLSLAPLAMAMLAASLSLAMSCWLRPWSNFQLGIGIFEVAKLRATAGLSPGVFSDLGQLTMYAERIDEDSGRLTNVIIADKRDPDTATNFIARFGELVSDREHRTLGLKLFDGTMQQGAGLNTTTTSFEVTTINLPFKDLLEESPEKSGKKRSEMSIAELRAGIRALRALPMPLSDDDMGQWGRYEVEYHRRLAIPMSCFCVAFLAVGLGIQPPRGRSPWAGTVNIIAGILLILGYYFLTALGSAFATDRPLTAPYIIWGPDVLLLVVGIVVFSEKGHSHWEFMTGCCAGALGKVAPKLKSLAYGKLEAEKDTTEAS